MIEGLAFFYDLNESLKIHQSKVSIICVDLASASDRVTVMIS